MANEATHIGRVKRYSLTNYYEMQCSRKDVHLQHLMGVSGAGGGSSGTGGPFRGTHEINVGITSETWCPGISEATPE